MNFTRISLLESTIQQLRHRRSQDLNVAQMCEDLGIRPSLVQYHFGSRENLIVEAAVTAYERYTTDLRHEVRDAARDPRTRLRTWMLGQFTWTVTNPSMASLLNYGLFVEGIDTSASDDQKQRVEVAGLNNLELMARLAFDLRRGSVTAAPITLESLDDVDQFNATLVSWFTLGMSTWWAGRHLPTRSMTQWASDTSIVNTSVERILDLIEES